MKRLYAPWRHTYVTDISKKNGSKDFSAQNCVFCQQFQSDDDEKYLIIRRFKYCAVMMNFYPYNAGHVMILPYEHKGDLHLLTSDTRAEIMEVVNISIQILGNVLAAEGFNVGINLGVAGGGGIPSHLHVHVLPRWRGDTNFLETLGQTKLISADIVETFKNLKRAFDGYAV